MTAYEKTKMGKIHTPPSGDENSVETRYKQQQFKTDIIILERRSKPATLMGKMFACADHRRP